MGLTPVRLPPKKYPLSKPGWEQFSPFFFDVKQCSVLCWDEKLRVAVLALSKPGWDEFSFSFCDVNLAFCYTTRLGCVQTFLL